MSGLRDLHKDHIYEVELHTSNDSKLRSSSQDRSAQALESGNGTSLSVNTSLRIRTLYQSEDKALQNGIRR